MFRIPTSVLGSRKPIIASLKTAQQDVESSSQGRYGLLQCLLRIKSNPTSIVRVVNRLHRASFIPRQQMVHPAAQETPPLEKHVLDKRFQVLGRFYLLEGAAHSYKCRDLLEIHREQILEDPCDAIFVMMNPGGSKPTDGVDSEPIARAKLAHTVPDQTQYQLMRLMEEFKWNRVRVLNLSDLRNAKSSTFMTEARVFSEREGHASHSIFCAKRKEELANALVRKANAPLFTAWGVSLGLREMASLALDAFGEKAIGLPHKNGPWAFLHPLPRSHVRQREWSVAARALLRPGEVKSSVGATTNDSLTPTVIEAQD